MLEHHLLSNLERASHPTLAIDFLFIPPSSACVERNRPPKSSVAYRLMLMKAADFFFWTDPNFIASLQIKWYLSAMRCPFCNNRKDRVVDSRESKEGNVIRRRRECLNCKRRFTSYERIEEVPYVVVKKGGSRESFDRSKLLKGLLKACEKRPVPAGQLEEIVEEVEQRFPETPDRELTSQEIGEYSMGRLKEIDKVAYVRFASVYLEFKDVREFMREINQLFERGK